MGAKCKHKVLKGREKGGEVHALWLPPQHVMQRQQWLVESPSSWYAVPAVSVPASSQLSNPFASVSQLTELHHIQFPPPTHSRHWCWGKHHTDSLNTFHQFGRSASFHFSTLPLRAIQHANKLRFVNSQPTDPKERTGSSQTTLLISS